MSYQSIQHVLKSAQPGTELTIKGWVRTKRESKNAVFIAVNDGSTINTIQAVAEAGQLPDETLKRITTGACVAITGPLVASQGAGQAVELKITHVHIYGPADPDSYPLQPKRHSLEFLREIAHLRPRTNTFSAILRVRHALAFAVHNYFNDNGFFYLHTPIITASDAEGAGEMFRVTTLDLNNLPFEANRFEILAEEYYDNIIRLIEEKGLQSLLSTINENLKSTDKKLDFKTLVKAKGKNLTELATNHSLRKVFKLFKELFALLEFDLYEKNDEKQLYLPVELVQQINPARRKIRAHRKFHRYKCPHLAFSFFNFSFVSRELNNSPDRKVIFEDDFFGRETNLTVSGQLEGELGALALGKIYTFGPTFRAENSNTTRHLAEFWMIEPEMAFFELEDNMNLAEDFVKTVIRYALQHCPDDLAFLDNRLKEEEKTGKKEERSELGLLEKLQFVISNEFERLTYTDAVEILVNSKPAKKGQFQYEVSWGVDLQSEHERYLVEKHFKKPVILTHYPRDIKAFYMKQDQELATNVRGEVCGLTVRAMDVLFPGIGEIIGGSQREDDLDKLTARMAEVGIEPAALWWYLDTRRFGSAPHAGFGLGFERLVQFVTGMGNIRDVIPFPRAPKQAEF